MNSLDHPGASSHDECLDKYSALSGLAIVDLLKNLGEFFIKRLSTIEPLQNRKFMLENVVDLCYLL